MVSDSGANTMVATEDDLKELWHRLLQTFLRYMRETPYQDLDPKYLNVIRAFLKDNGLDAEGSHQMDVEESLKRLSGMDLPFNLEPPKLQ